MGNTIWVEAQGRPGTETHFDMGKLKRLAKELDALAARLGVRRLSDFYDFLPVLEANQSDEDSVPLPEPSWFNSSDGLESVRALLACLEKDFGELSWTPDDARGHWPSELIDELRSCETVLAEAVKAGQKFRLMVVP